MGFFNKVKKLFNNEEVGNDEFKNDEQSITNNDYLRERLSKSKEGFFSKIKNIFFENTKINEELFEDLEDLLISSDIGFNTTKKIITELEKEVSKNKITKTEDVYEKLKSIMSNFLYLDNNFNIKENSLNVLLIVGVNGVGKTTTIGKLASKYKKENKKVVLAAADTFRAAAVEQLEEWAKRSDSILIKGKEGVDPASVVFDALDYSLENKADILIIDTAGRLHNKENLMRELEKINSIIKRKIGEQKFECLLILDGTTGQNGLIQAKEFNEVTDLTGFIVTKLDGTSKGGIVFSISEELKKPIVFIGIGEKISDLVEFNSQDFINTIFD